jgi:hypothetical protein
MSVGMAKLSVLVALSLFAGWVFLYAADVQQTNSSAPVLVELFTSEGCSSCPPADQLLQQLDKSQPVAGAQLIVLSEHVDYWNQIGWTDPYSSRFFSDRQSAYSENFKLNTVYTPQMVVDGTTEFVGNDSSRATQAIHESLKQKKVPVRISGISLDGANFLRAHVEAEGLPDSSRAGKADVFLVVALNHAESNVLRGENGGRRLTHVAVVKSVTKLGSVDIGKNFAKDVQLKLDSKTDPNNLRLIAFVQQPNQHQVLGAALQRVER